MAKMANTPGAQTPGSARLPMIATGQVKRTGKKGGDDLNSPEHLKSQFTNAFAKALTNIKNKK